ncbi:tetratricopeptide repeat protein [Patescibacteria group bacterium]|nr:tetratricopeptide repeat protein [Patescibacteria group bacterium]
MSEAHRGKAIQFDLKDRPDLKEPETEDEEDVFQEALAELQEEKERAQEREPSITLDELTSLLSKFQHEAKGKNDQERTMDVEAKMNDILDKAKNRIRKECGSIEQFTAMGKAIKLIANDPERERTLKKKRNTASYDFTKGDITINEDYKKAFKPSQILGEIALLQKSNLTQSIHHEHIHRQQFGKPGEKTNFRDIANQFNSYAKLQRLATPKEHAQLLDIKRLAELQANIGSKRFHKQEQIRNRAGLSTQEAVKIIGPGIGPEGGGYNFIFTYKDLDKALMAAWDIKALYALGVKDGEISEMINEAKWDPENNSYDSLERRIQEKMTEQKIEREDVDNMIFLHDVKQDTYILKASRIVAEEIDVAASNTRDSEHFDAQVFVNIVDDLISEQKESFYRDFCYYLVKENRDADMDAIYDAVSKKYPDSDEMRSNFGQLFLQLQKYESAATAYKQALELLPNDADRMPVLMALSQVYDQLDLLDEEEAVLRKACNIAPDFSLLFNGLCKVLEKQGKYPELIDLYNKRIKDFPNERPNYEDLAKAYVATGQKHKAINMYNKLIVMNPEKENAYMARIQLLENK